MVSLLSRAWPLPLAGVAAVFGGLLLTGSTSAASPSSAPLIAFWNGTSWTQQPIPNPQGSGSLTAVAAVSATDVWALGSHGIQGDHPNALAEHWDGSSWRPAAIPTPKTANQVHLFGMAAISATDGWAVGSWSPRRASYSTLTEHWDGSSWTIVPGPQPGLGRELYGVAALSATDAWAVGYYQQRVAGGFVYARPLVLHWNGARWTQVEAPHPGCHGDSQLAGVVAVAPRSVWAVGTYDGVESGRCRPGRTGSARTLILRWNGQEWKQMSSPNARGSNQLFAVAAAGPDDLWAVGGSGNGSRGRPLAEHWNGRAWRMVPAPSGHPKSTSQALTALAVLADDNIWAAGRRKENRPTGQYNFSYTLSEHWDGHAWSPVAGPNPAPDNSFSGIAAATPNAVWAVGTEQHQGS